MIKRIVSYIKKQLSSFRLKKDLIKEFTTIQQNLDNKLYDIIAKVEELDPTKIYYVYEKEATQGELYVMNDAYDRVRARMKWTAPKIIFTNAEFKTLEREALEKILKENF